MSRAIHTPLITLLILLLALGAALPAVAQDSQPAPDEYADLTIEALRKRSYGGGTVTIQETLAQTDAFTRYLITYPSDDLMIAGFMNLPHGRGPFPVIIALHGYIDPARYYTLDYTTRYADDLARAGYLVLHPNLRGYAPSDSGPNLFRVGMAVDVLNLAAIVRQTGGMAGDLFAANPEAIGLWGHSMGGGISLRTITVDPEIDAALLYAAMSGDEARNFAAINEWSGGERGLPELDVSETALEAISPIYHLDNIETAVSIHHGAADELVPPAWSEELCARLQNLGKTAHCYSYVGQPHTFTGEGDRIFVQNTINFFDAYLKTQPIP